MDKKETENNKRKAFWQLHISVMLAGFTGLFGKLITLNEVDIVWYRMLFTSLILMVFTGLPRVGWKKFLQIAGCGALLGLHWMLFYSSIKASNVSIGVVCFALVGFFTAIFEPIVFRRKVSWAELLLSLITVSRNTLIHLSRNSSLCPPGSEWNSYRKGLPSNSSKKAFRPRPTG